MLRAPVHPLDSLLLINTLLQRGVRNDVGPKNRFNGFSRKSQ